MNTDFTILIAEDDDVNFFLLDLWLRDLCKIIHAKNGKEAVSLFNAHPEINLIIMDVRMPYMNGIEATKIIRHTNKEIPIIAHTAYAMNDERTNILDAGCTEILIKPTRKENCLALITNYKNQILQKN